MKILQAVQEGLRRVGRAKRVIFWIYLFNLVAALIPALALAGLMRESLGQSLAAEELRQGFSSAWYAEFRVEARGLAATFDPSVVGMGALLNGLDAFITGSMFRDFAGIVGVGVLYLLGWTFFAGGVLHLYSSNEAPSRENFLAACARYFPRFLRLAVFAGILYYLIYAYVLSGLGEFVSARLRDIIDERIAFLWTAAKYLVVAVLLVCVNLVFDYARIATVLENRRSMLLATLRALRLVGAHPLRTAGLYLLVALIGLLFLGVYSLLPEKPWEQTWRGVTVTFLAGQLYIVSRIWTRLLFYAGQSALGGAFLEPTPAENPENLLGN